MCAVAGGLRAACPATGGSGPLFRALHSRQRAAAEENAAQQREHQIGCLGVIVSLRPRASRRKEPFVNQSKRNMGRQAGGRAVRVGCSIDCQSSAKSTPLPACVPLGSLHCVTRCAAHPPATVWPPPAQATPYTSRALSASVGVLRTASGRTAQTATAPHALPCSSATFRAAPRHAAPRTSDNNNHFHHAANLLRR